jgi:CBS domain-containing protein
MKRAVRDVMTKTVVAVSQDFPFKEIVRRMEEYRVSAVPVIDGNGRLVGIVSEADLLFKEEFDTPAEREPRLFERKARRLERSKASVLVASQLMTTPVVIIEPDASIARAARLMDQKGVKRLPVLDEGGRIVGIVSRSDLLKPFLRPDEEIAGEVVEALSRPGSLIGSRDLRVQVREGVVSLRGIVEQRSMLPVVKSTVLRIDGVVAVENGMGYDVDDTSWPPEYVTPWGLALPRVP